MPTGLQLDANNDFLLLDSQVTISGEFSIEVDFTAPSPLATQIIVGRHDSASDYIAIFNNGTINMRYSGKTALQVSGVVAGQRHLARFYKVVNDVYIDLDGNVSVIEYGGTDFVFNVFGKYQSQLFFGGQIHSIKTSGHHWDATASNSADVPVKLVDTIGGNNAIGFGMPTDGSAWIGDTPPDDGYNHLYGINFSQVITNA